MSFANDILIKAGIISKPTPVPAPIKKKRAEPAKFKPILPGQRRERWTPEEDAVLERLVETHTPEQAAIEMKRSYQAVRKRAIRIGLEFKLLRGHGYTHWTEEMKSRVAELYNQRDPMLSNREISQILNMTVNQVRGIACYLGLSGRTHRWTLTEEILVAKHFNTCGPELLGKIMNIKSTAISAKNLILTTKGIKKHRAKVEISHDVVIEYLSTHNINK